MQSDGASSAMLHSLLLRFSSENENAAMFVNSDPRIHELDGDVGNYRLWLIKMPAEVGGHYLHMKNLCKITV